MAKQTFYEGQTASNPSTGERLVYRGGKWFPMGAASSGAAAPVPAGSTQDRDALQALRDDAANTLSTAQAANEFVRYNEKSPTGGLVGRPIIPLTKAIPGAPLWGDVGAALSGDNGWSQMKAISSALAPAQRQPGSGSSSNIDVAMFKEALPNIDAPGPANRLNAERLQTKSDMAAARSAFMDEWFRRNGSLVGAEQQFASFWSRRKAGDPAANNRPSRAEPARGGGSKGGSFKILGVE